jgi:ABC-2 type transport system permease protein
VFALALLALVGVGTAAVVQPLTNDAVVNVRRALHNVLTDGAGAAVFVSLILGALVSTWEYRHRILTHTLLAAPRRERVIGAKAVVAAGLGLLLGALATIVALAIAIPWLGSGSAEELATGDLWQRSARVVLTAALAGAIGSGLGAAIASQVGSIVAIFLWFSVAEPIVGGFLEGVRPYLPGGAMQVLIGGDGHGVSPLGGLLLTLGYVAVFTVVGMAATSRRDVT